MNDLQFKPATRTHVKPLIGMYGKSGSGKTMSALLLARGLVGPNGRVCLIDSESGRGSLFADIIPGGYNVIDIEPPFSPERYQAAFDLAEKQADVVIIDSLSHEHAGEGGILDMQEAELNRMAGDNWQKREAVKMSSWIKPKIAHKKFVQRILRSKVPLICCLRGEEKTHMEKVDGKTKVITDAFSSPIFDSRFLFELLVNFEVIAKNGQGGFVIPRKITHPDIATCVPADNEQITIEHGEAIARWAKGGAASPPAQGKPPAAGGQKASPSSGDSKLDAARAQLKALRIKRNGADYKAFEQWLYDEGHIADTERIAEFGAARIVQLCDTIEPLID